MKVRSQFHKLVSFVCALAMLAGMVTLPVSAANPADNTAGGTFTWDYATDGNSFPAGGYFTGNGTLGEGSDGVTSGKGMNGNISFTVSGTATVTIVTYASNKGAPGLTKGSAAASALVDDDAKSTKDSFRPSSETTLTYSSLDAGTYYFGNIRTSGSTLVIKSITVVQTGACDHNWVAGAVTKAPTCTEKGAQTYTCSKCSESESRELAALGHTEEAIPAVAATCTTDGATAGVKCSVCDTVLEAPQTIAATGAHNWVNGECSVCHLPQTHTHTYDNAAANTTVTKQPTCTEAGSKTVKCDSYDQCGDTKIEVIPATGHTEVNVEAVDVTCTTDGSTAGVKCSVCQAIISGCAKITAPGHQWNDTECTVCHTLKPADNLVAGGWFETLYAEIEGISAADVSSVTYKGAMSGKLTGEDKKFLVRNVAKLSSGKAGVRIDIPGLPAGEYTMTVVASGVTMNSSKVTVMPYDRSGYAHWQYTEGVGAYRDDGILKDNAIVLYVTEQNKNDVELEGPDGTVVKGIGNILNSVGANSGNGMTSNGGVANTNGNILRKLADADIPLVVRFIGTVYGGSDGNPGNPGSKGHTLLEGLTVYNSVDGGGTVGDNGFMARMKAGRNITLEGIGTDAVIDGWGFHFMANTGDYEAGRGKSFEARNLTFQESPEDSLGMEGVQAQKNPQSALSAPVERCWVHNCAFYPAHITSPAESDKADGDGACDFKRGQYMTMSYNYFEGCHKTNLLGANGNTVQFHITWHHNYWKNNKARGPLARNANMHIYNNLYEGQTDTTMSLRSNAYVFAEYNTFLNCHRPVEYKAEKGSTGICKSYNNSFIGCFENMDATVVTDKSTVVSSTNRYPSFELDASMSYIPSGDYKLDQSLAEAKANIEAYTGPMKAHTEIKAPEVDTTGGIPEDMIPAANLPLPYDQELNKTYVTTPKVLDAKTGISFFVGKVDAAKLVLGGKESGAVGAHMGYDIVFKVDKKVDITVDAPSGSATTKTVTSHLMSADGLALLEGGGTVKNCPPGVYYIQSNYFDTSTIGSNKMKFKEAAISGLKVVESADQSVHTHDWDAGTVTVASTCIKAGTKIYTCSGCGETRREELPLSDHTMAGGQCVDCGLLDGILNADPNAPEIHVTDLTLDLDGQSVTILQGDSVKGIAATAPANASNRAVTWESSDPAVASVSKAGVVTGKAPGTATITVTSDDNPSATASFTVTVIGIITKTYKFAAKTHGGTQDDQAAAAAGAYGEQDYFTLTGSGNQWRTKGKAKGVAPMALELKTNEGGAMTFTVESGATANVAVSYQSTSSSNTSAIALKAADGSYVFTSAGSQISAGSGQSAGGSAGYERLPAGTYSVVVPKDVDPDDLGLEEFASDKTNNPNGRNTQLISVTVTTTKAVSGDYVEVSGITLDQTSATIEAGESLVLGATVVPNNASNPTVTWSSSNLSVAAVSGGTVTGRTAGSAVITAKAGGYTATCNVTVTAATGTETVKVTGITVTDASGETSGAITADDDEALTVALKAAISPDDADNKGLTWSSNATAKGVTVNTAGVVTVAAGAQSCTAVITATAKDGSNVRGTYTLTVTGTTAPVDPTPTPTPTVVAVTGVTLNTNALELAVGETADLSATVQPGTATNKSVSWTSSAASVASVSSSGKVTAVAAGTATITVTTADGSKTATCTVTVTAGATSNTVTKTFQAGKLSDVTTDSTPVTEPEMTAIESGFFTANGDVLKRATKVSSGSVTNGKVASVEIKPVAASSLSFQIAGTGEVTVKASSTGSVNWTGVRLEKKSGESWTAVNATITAGETIKFFPGSTSVVLVFNTTAQEIKYTGLEKGVYRVVVPDMGGETGKFIMLDGTQKQESDYSALGSSDEDKAEKGKYPFNRNARITEITVKDTTTSGGTIAATGVRLDKTTLELDVGGTAKLTATVEPGTATNKSVSWSTSDAAVAEVDASGNVSALAAGSATVTATTANGKTAGCSVTVKSAAAPTPTPTPDPGATPTPTPDPGATPTPAPTQAPGSSGSSGGSGANTPSKQPVASSGGTTTVTPGVSAINKDGSVVTEITAEAANVMVEEAAKNKSDVVTVNAGAVQDTTDVTVNLPNASVKKLVNKTTADLEIKTAVGSVKLQHETLRELSGAAKDSVGVSMAQKGNAVKVTFLVDNAAVDKVPGASATVPAEGMAASTVAVLVDADGTETIVKKSVVMDGQLSVTLNGSGTIKVVDNKKEFVDVADSWAKDPIDFASSHELFNGVAPNEFAPNQPMTRSMLVTVLFRLEDAKDSGAKVSFSDVESGSWYTTAVAWASGNGIVTGKSDKVFAPEEDITREQLATILYRYATKLCGEEGVDSKDTVLEGYSDYVAVSGFAQEGMIWAVQTGIISGRNGHTLAPGGTASRAEVATMLMRFVKAIS